MISELASKNAPLTLVIIGLVMFVALFTGIVLSTFRKSNSDKFSKISQIPLQDEEGHSHV